MECQDILLVNKFEIIIFLTFRFNLDDEDINDEQEEIPSSSTKNFANEHQRFTHDKELFKKKYQKEINRVKGQDFNSISLSEFFIFFSYNSS